MDMLDSFYDKFSFLLAFMILVLILNLSIGDTFTKNFLVLVLLSMIIFNVDTLSELLKPLKGE